MSEPDECLGEAAVYENPPRLENELVLLRPVTAEDAPALLSCYGDAHAVPYFNSDHCNGDDFHYTTAERVAAAIAFWEQSRARHEFVRWSVADQSLGEVVGTVEMFHRRAPDEHDHAGVLRVDVQSRLETRAFLYAVFSLCLRHFYDAFEVERILTKAPPFATERIFALEAAGFTPLTGNMNGNPFYYERTR